MTKPAPASAAPAPLDVESKPRRRLVGWVLGALAVLPIAWWYAAHPEPLPTSPDRVSASTPAGRPVYVGAFTPPADFDRTLHVSGVKVQVTATAEVEVTPWLCRGGTIGVTSEPETFCAELVDPEGQELGAGDAVVLEVSGDVPAAAAIERIRIGYREGIQADTQQAGSPIVVTIAAP